MATNKPYGDGKRIGAVRARSQVNNPNGDQWTKRNKKGGQFMDLKADNKPSRASGRKNSARHHASARSLMTAAAR